MMTLHVERFVVAKTTNLSLKVIPRQQRYCNFYDFLLVVHLPDHGKPNFRVLNTSARANLRTSRTDSRQMQHHQLHGLTLHHQSRLGVMPIDQTWETMPSTLR